jgi:hypothetical protein
MSEADLSYLDVPIGLILPGILIESFLLCWTRLSGNRADTTLHWPPNELLGA